MRGVFFAAVEKARSVRPDLVISDVIMPDMNGIDAAIQIRGFLPSCKILLFSGQAATADLLENARQRGHDSHRRRGTSSVRHRPARTRRSTRRSRSARSRTTGTL